LILYTNIIGIISKFAIEYHKFSIFGYLNRFNYYFNLFVDEINNFYPLLITIVLNSIYIFKAEAKQKDRQRFTGFVDDSDFIQFNYKSHL